MEEKTMKTSSRMAVLALALFFGGLITIVASTALAQDVTRVSMGTAGTTGVYYFYGGAVANVVSKNVPELQITSEATAGSVENLKLIMGGEIAMATVTADVLNEAVNGWETSKRFKEKVEVYGLFNMYTQPMHVVALADSGVNSIQDLKGKRVAVGAPGSGSEVKTKALLSIMGLEYNKDFTPEFLSFAEGAQALQDKTADAMFVSSAIPNPAIMSLAMTNPLKLIPMTDEEVAKIEKEYPFMTLDTIPADTYKGIGDVQTVCVQSLMVSSKGFPDDLAYKMVKTVFEDKAELEQIHSAFKRTLLENAPKMIVPTHPGALRYFKEKGVVK